MKKILLPLLSIILISSVSFGQRNYFPSNLLPNSTIRIVGFRDTLINGKKQWITTVGTGFFYEFEIDGMKLMTIVTNKHVVENSSYDRFTFKKVDSNYKLGDVIKSDTLTISKFNEQWIYHPSEDLAILLFDSIKNRFTKKYNKDILYTWFGKDIIPSYKDSIKISSIEKVLMVGYPKSLWDSTNNLPVIRQGLTATPFFSDFNGRKRFLIDIPTFHGSSGSPVLLYSFEPFWEDTLWVRSEFRTYLLGIAVESYTYDAYGKLMPYDPNTIISDSLEKKYKLQMDIPLNIAIVIKAERLFDFDSLIKSYLQKKRKK